MADVADAAGISRPALYQYFRNRSDLFAAAFALLLDEAADSALVALKSPAPLADQLDGFLQRLSGDGYAALAATPFGDELLEAKHEFAADVAHSAHHRAQNGLRKHLQNSAPADPRARAAALDLLTLAPAGLKQDHPTPATYRRRLTFLARAVATSVPPR
jgi:AcrR family transcriptional regulator